ncbi:hypothetical protein GUJ93_ZPchr0010g9647, partial [Zizania palustris]
MTSEEIGTSGAAEAPSPFEPGATTAVVTAATTSGLVITTTDPLCSFLSSAAASGDFSADLHDLGSTLALHFVLTSPKPRDKSDELKVRLKKLREMSGTSLRGRRAPSHSPPTRTRSDSIPTLSYPSILS